MTSTPSQPVSVLLVDDDALVRSALRLILGGDPAITVVGEASDGLEGVALVESLRPDVVLMDIRMPRLDGLAATERALALQPDLVVVVLTTFDTDDMVLSALRLGARGFLLKDTPPADLVAAVRAAAAGQPMLSPSVTGQLIAAVAAPGPRQDAEARARLATLTEREHEVALAVARGQSNAEIAASLFMSVATVKSHVGRLFGKLGVENRVQVAICVHEAGL
ncbi:response regulator [Sanguibacter inulinus]|uniref:Response regulator transcription factor n=1 Tax=Sanguibacter inulinus TaxID=60922 RepID=A0A853EYN1_9MICO|nr:response regulator transcription factor [Sanguibacter inulinus]MBF0724406.1 response regulator transcription factor [Sanguibacter inulinus]NYS95551.1 response regulator transcription factor [Sanguibacter inulinus]